MLDDDKMPNVLLENHEIRIKSLEAQIHEQARSFESRLVESTNLRLDMQDLKGAMTTLKEYNEKQDIKLEKQNTKLDKMTASLNRMILGILTTLVMLLIKIVLDLTILKPH